MRYYEASHLPVSEATWPEDQDFDDLEPDDALPDELFPAFRDKQALIIPRLQTMDNYIKIHYKRVIIEKLCKMVKAEGIEHILPGSAVISRMNYWRTDRTSILVDLTISALIQRKDDTDTDYEETNYIVQVGFWIKEEITYICGSFCVLWGESDHSGHWPLSEYLIPHLKKTDVEKYAQELLHLELPEGWRDQHLNTAQVLAERLKLKTVHLPLHGYGRTRSILFFQKGKITIDVKDEASNITHRRHEIVEANTIVINKNVVKCDTATLDIYHECIHAEWHYLFYKLQAMHNNDLRQIRKYSKLRYDKSGERDPLSWLEWQAWQGSMSLWMPRNFMQEEIGRIGSRLQHSSMHLGARFDHIGRSIAKAYDIPKYRVRSRLINMGYIEAKGALNYLDNHYVRPFCFSRDGNTGHYTFFITSKEFSKLYQEDEKLRELIATGKFVYAEGHICLDDPKYILSTSAGPILTTWANAHVDECCLRFIEVYEQDDVLAYRFGRLNSDETFNSHFYKFPGCGDISGLSGEQMDEKLHDYINSLPRTFPRMLTKFMNDAKMTEDRLIEVTGLSESSVTRLRNNQRENYKVDQVVALIAVLHLPPLVSCVFLQSAGIDLTGNGVNSRYALVVYTLYQYPVKRIQEMLDYMGFPRLKLSDENDQERVS